MVITLKQMNDNKISQYVEVAIVINTLCANSGTVRNYCMCQNMCY